MAKRGQRVLGDIEVHSRLADGTEVCLRAITPEDGPLLRAGIATLSAESRYLRFFSPAPMPPDPVVARLVDVDGHDHIAWGALCTGCEGTPAIGAVHAVRHADGGEIGEYSVAVVDAFHGQGLSRMMTAALLIQCRAEGLAELDVHTLSDNHAAVRLMQSLGATWKGGSAGVSEYRIDVSRALDGLKADRRARGVQDVFRALAAQDGG